MLNGLGDLLRHTLRDPRSAARAILGLDLPVQARWLALVLVVVLTVLATQIGLLLFPLPASSAWDVLMRNGLLAVPLQVAFLALVALGMSHVGRRFGGRGRFDDALILVAWLETVMLVVQLAQLVAVLAVPPLGLLIGIVSLGLFFWLLTAFTAELNGFDSLPKVFLGILGTMFLAGFALVALFATLGISLPVPGP